jgi:5-methylcytosine-specific restriction protein A
MRSKRAASDAKYDEEKRRTHPDFHFWRSRQWRDHIRPAQLRRAPLCEICAERGVTTLATQVDHRIRPMGNPSLQRDASNLRSICTSCHSRKTQADQRGFSKDVDIDGYPTDPNHLANKPRRQTHDTGGERKI